MKKIIVFATSVLLAMGLLVACGPPAADSAAKDTTASSSTAASQIAEYRKISAEQAKEMMDANPDAIILDVRTQQEFDEKHIEGALLLPDFELEEKAAAILQNKDDLILIYCRSGNRSRTAANTLLALGYTNVYDFGGIIDWPYDTVSSN